MAITAAFFLVLIASFMSWGTIRYHFTWQFMANMEHPGLCNRILTGDDLSGLKLGAKLNQTGSAWGFFSQGSIGWGLALTGTGYLIFLVAFLRRQ